MQPNTWIRHARAWDYVAEIFWQLNYQCLDRPDKKDSGTNGCCESTPKDSAIVHDNCFNQYELYFTVRSIQGLVIRILEASNKQHYGKPIKETGLAG